MNNIVYKVGVILFTASLMFSGLAFAEKIVKKVAVIQDLVLSDGYAVLNDGLAYQLDSDLVSSLYRKKRAGGWDWSVGKPVVVKIERVAPGKSDFLRVITSIEPPLKEEKKK